MAKLSKKHPALMLHNQGEIKHIIREALLEDRADNDITSRLLFSAGRKAKAVIIAKEKCAIAGLDIARQVFYMLDKKIKFKPLARDGGLIKRGKVVAELEGNLRSILKGERVALNFLMRLSGIATLTRRFVSIVRPFKTKIMDTRKTTPGLRILEKYAVGVGGGVNHRMNLGDAVLIKDNHFFEIKNHCLAGRQEKSKIKSLIQKIRENIPNGMSIEIETSNLKEFKKALEAGPDIIMLDNMGLSDIKKAVLLRNQKKAYRNQRLEVSGGVNLENVLSIAKTGVERISVGSLTHSYRSIDFSLKVIR
jgi:nicotinate-nucleotide pyrophosphorylase (carboxylating)